MTDIPALKKNRLMFDPLELCYDFGPLHPMHSRRIEALIDLLETSDLWQRSDERTGLAGRSATLVELQLAHTQEYISAVQHLSEPMDDLANGKDLRARIQMAAHYGFGDGDTPVVPEMHQATSLVVGSTLVALSAVMGLPEGGIFQTEEERPLHVFHPSGGFHHALAERASGFCIYNDIVVAIAHILRSTEAKVLYIDFDAHHGDGVQRAFYDEPRVMTISLHETGRYLFPGTGDVLELGSGLGRGYTVNMPLEPFTEDDSYIEVMNMLLHPLAISFAPDIIVSLHGCDTHAWDPLTHLSLTTCGILAQAKIAHELAHTYSNGRWVALGGGGYDHYRVLPRAWSLVWAEMSEQKVPERLPESWIERWKPLWQVTQEQEEEAQQVMGNTDEPAIFPVTFEDVQEDFPPRPRRAIINRTNKHTAALVRNLIIPYPVRHAFPSKPQSAPLADLFDMLHLKKAGTPSRTKTLETKQGTLLLRDFCPPSLVERLKMDSGLHAFTRYPEREHQLLLNIARHPDCALALAHTPAGEIIAEVTIAPTEDWWEGLENVYEVAGQVSSSWRGMRIASELFTFALAFDTLEDVILLAMGLSWHWDLESLGIPSHRYRQLIAHLFGGQGFVEYNTAEPNISMEPANILLARVGKRVEKHVADKFLSRLLSSPGFAGF